MDASSKTEFITKKKTRKGSIRTKLALSFSILILLSSVINGFISISSSSNSLTEAAETSVALAAYEAAALLESRMQTRTRTLEMIAFRPDMQTMDWETQEEIIQNQLANTDFFNIGVVEPNGSTRYQDGTTSELGDADNIKKALAGESSISDPLFSIATGDMIIVFTVPIYQGSSPVGALVGYRDANALSEITDDMGYGDNGYGFIIDSQGTIIAHPDRQRVLDQFNPIEASKDDQVWSPTQLF